MWNFSLYTRFKLSEDSLGDKGEREQLPRRQPDFFLSSDSLIIFLGVGIDLIRSYFSSVFVLHAYLFNSISSHSSLDKTEHFQCRGYVWEHDSFHIDPTQVADNTRFRVNSNAQDVLYF